MSRPLPLQSDARPVGVGVVNGEGGELVREQQVGDPLVLSERDRVCAAIGAAMAGLVVLPARIRLLEIGLGVDRQGR